MSRPGKNYTSRAGRWKNWLSSAAYYLLAGIIALVLILPLIWMVTASLRAHGLPPPRGIEWLPRPISWSNYQTIFQVIPLGRYIFNSLVVSVTAVGLTLVTASWGGFAMSQLGWRAQRLLLILSVALLMVPLTTLWLTRYVLFAWFGWIDSYFALIAPALMGSSSFFILLFFWAFRRISMDSIDSARLDGASPLTIWRLVAMPQVKPTTMTVAVLSYVLYWNDFINPLLYMKSSRMYTLAVGLQQLQQLDRTNWPLLLAAAVVMCVPVILLYWLAQKYFLNPISQ